jgi:hypothetical protein
MNEGVEGGGFARLKRLSHGQQCVHRARPPPGPRPAHRQGEQELVGNGVLKAHLGVGEGEDRQGAGMQVCAHAVQGTEGADSVPS